MKKECEIVQDLLFCYYDGVASNSSKGVVENHLQACENCRQALKDIEKDRNKQENHEEIEYLKKINQKMKKKTIIAIISLVILATFVISNLYILGSFYQNGYQITIILKDEISQEQLENIKQLLVSQYDERKIEYLSKEDALNQVKEKFKDKQDLINNYAVENPFKATITVKTKQNQEEELLKLLENLEGINHIKTNTVDNPYLWFISNFLKNK